MTANTPVWFLLATLLAPPVYAAFMARWVYRDELPRMLVALYVGISALFGFIELMHDVGRYFWPAP